MSGRAILPSAHHSDLYLTALGILLMIIDMAGLLYRPGRLYARLGADSIAVMTTHLIGVTGLVFLPS